MEQDKIKKEITLDGLAELINETRESLEKKIDSSVEEIATMTQNEFIKMNTKMDEGFKKVNVKMDNGFEELRGEMRNTKTDFNKKVDVFTHKDLEHRVEKAEEGLKKHKMMFHEPAKSNA